MVLNLDTVMDSMFAQDVTDGGMLDFIDGLCQFDLRINDAMPVFEKGRKLAKADVTVFVDCRSDYSSAVLAVPAGVVGPSAKKGDAKGCSADDHPVTFPCSGLIRRVRHAGTPFPAANELSWSDAIGLEHYE